MRIRRFSTLHNFLQGIPRKSLRSRSRWSRNAQKLAFTEFSERSVFFLRGIALGAHAKGRGVGAWENTRRMRQKERSESTGGQSERRTNIRKLWLWRGKRRRGAAPHRGAAKLSRTKEAGRERQSFRLHSLWHFSVSRPIPTHWKLRNAPRRALRGERSGARGLVIWRGRNFPCRKLLPKKELRNCRATDRLYLSPIVDQ